MYKFICTCKTKTGKIIGKNITANSLHEMEQIFSTNCPDLEFMGCSVLKITKKEIEEFSI